MQRGRNVRSGRPPVRGGSELHRAWLGLLQTEGPFLSVPVLKATWPNGFVKLGYDRAERAALDDLKAARPEFERAWDRWLCDVRKPGAHSVQESFAELRRARQAWVDAVTLGVFGWEGMLQCDQGSGSACDALAVFSPDGATRLAPTGALMYGNQPCALLLVVDPQDAPLDKNYPEDTWSASALDRMAALLRGPAGSRGCSVGVVTDGRWWALVSAPLAGPCAWGMTDALTWSDSPEVLCAFARLLDVRLLRPGAGLGGTTLPQMFEASVSQAEEVTESLGLQVRQAVELLVAAFCEASRAARAQGLPDPLPADVGQVYEAAVCVMMRVVFLLFAQERDLLPASAVFVESYGMLGVLRELEERSAREGEEAMDGTSLAWHRLLAASQAVYAGATFEDMRMPAYGGSVFDPARHPFLTQVSPKTGGLDVAVSDRVMLHVLESVQKITVPGDPEPRPLSFREIDVEQIGYIYEGLLGFTCVRAQGCVLGLKGKGGRADEPEVPLDVLEGLRAASPEPAALASAIVGMLKDGELLAKGDIPSKSAYEKPLKAPALDADFRLAQVTRDEAMRERLRPWMPLVRNDLRGKPVVFQPGDLYVTATSSRKDAGAHYTPRSLAESVVVHALQPLAYSPGPYQTADAAQWRRRPSNEILDLKVADIACGSGAFLVAAARYLAGELAAAWAAEGQFGELSGEERTTLALRKVVANCIYGVDINEMAVEMCKLSLWLVSLDRSKPFSFVDNKVLTGNSLLGVTDAQQLRYLSFDGGPRTVGHTKTGRLFELDDGARVFARSIDLDDTLREARGLRSELAQDISESDPMRGRAYKRRLMGLYDEKVGVLRRVGDALVATGLIEEPKHGSKKSEKALDELAAAVARAFPADDERPDAEKLDDITRRGLTPEVRTDYVRWQCLHWPVEFPEVAERGGFDAVVGNPPFLGGQKLTGSMGANVRNYYIQTLAGGAKGSADLCAYFFLQAYGLVRPGGTLGLLATNTIAQGATREVGLDQMVARGFTIMRAVRSEKWPTSNASLEYAAVWGCKGTPAQGAERVCDGKPAAKISTLLEPEGRVSGKPVPLKENEGVAFQGCIVLGMGFVLEPEEAQAWIAADPKNKEVLFPYLNGEDLNSRPDCSASRWVIDFNQREEDEAKQYALPYARVLEKVKPEREKKEDPTTSNAPWWQYLRTRPAMRKAIAGLDEVMVIAQVSKTLMPQFVSSKQVLDAKLIVFASSTRALLAILSSSIHYVWSIQYGTTMRTDPTYVPSALFSPFPRPLETPELDVLGRELDCERRQIMLCRQLGLTALYNLVNDPDMPGEADPDVVRMRDIHRRLDEAVMDAYGWGDVELDHGFYEYRKMVRWTVCPQARAEILDRLLEENHRRARLQESTSQEEEQ